PSRLFRMWFRSVVLPAPRNPERTVTGRRWSRVCWLTDMGLLYFMLRYYVTYLSGSADACNAVSCPIHHLTARTDGRPRRLECVLRITARPPAYAEVKQHRAPALMRRAQSLPLPDRT